MNEECFSKGTHEPLREHVLALGCRDALFEQSARGRFESATVHRVL